MITIEQRFVRERRRRERVLTGQGWSAAEIAVTLGVTPRTIVRYRRRARAAQ